MKWIIVLLTFVCLAGCKKQENVNEELDKLAKRYVRLGLKIGQYDSDFVDAYYGPDSLKPTSDKQPVFPKDSLLKEVEDLKSSAATIISSAKSDSLKSRAMWLSSQLTAFGRRIKIFTGEAGAFDEESKDLFDAVAPTYSEKHFQSLLQQLDSVLPGKGSVPERFQKLADHFLLPKDRIDTVFRAAIAEARKRTLAHYNLPKNESFTLEYVTDKPWSGYNYYQGQAVSKIEINSDFPIYTERAIDLGCHEGYPGHHVYNALLEQTFVRERGWIEMSVYPLFSPMSLVAEGSANYGIDLAFPGDESAAFERDVLMPLAGLAPADVETKARLGNLMRRLARAEYTIADDYLSGRVGREESIARLSKYGLTTPDKSAQRLRFIDTYRSYIINYGLGRDTVQAWVERPDAPWGTDHWQGMETLLSSQILPVDLVD